MGGKEEEEKEKSWDIVFMEGYLKKLSKKVNLLFYLKHYLIIFVVA